MRKRLFPFLPFTTALLLSFTLVVPVRSQDRTVEPAHENAAPAAASPEKSPPEEASSSSSADPDKTATDGNVNIEAVSEAIHGAMKERAARAPRERKPRERKPRAGYYVFGVATEEQVWHFKFYRQEEWELILLGEGSLDSKTYKILEARPLAQEDGTTGALPEFRDFQPKMGDLNAPELGGDEWKEAWASDALDKAFRANGWVAPKDEPGRQMWLNMRTQGEWLEFAYFTCVPPSKIQILTEFVPGRGRVNPRTMEVEIAKGRML
jgi:hypothetical protein